MRVSVVAIAIHYITIAQSVANMRVIRRGRRCCCRQRHSRKLVERLNVRTCYSSAIQQQQYQHVIVIAIAIMCTLYYELCRLRCASFLMVVATFVIDRQTDRQRKREIVWANAKLNAIHNTKSHNTNLEIYCVTSVEFQHHQNNKRKHIIPQAAFPKAQLQIPPP